MCAAPSRSQPSKLFNKVALVNKPFRKIAKTIISQTSGNFYRADLQNGEAAPTIHSVHTALWLHAGSHVVQRAVLCRELWCLEPCHVESWPVQRAGCREPCRAGSCAVQRAACREPRVLGDTPCR